MINNYNVDKSSTVFPNVDNFIGLGSIYYLAVSKPFYLKNGMSASTVLLKGTEFAKNTIEELKKKYPDDPFAYTYYLNSAAVYEILVQAFSMSTKNEFESDLIPLKKFNNVEINWTLGAAIYFYSSKKANESEIMKDKAA